MLPAIAVASSVTLASLVIYVSVHSALRASLDERLRTLTRSVLTAPDPAARRTPPSQRLDRALGRSFLLVLPSSPLGEHSGYAQVVSDDGTIQRPARHAAAGVRLPAGPKVVAIARGMGHPYFYDARLGRTPVRVYVSRFGPSRALQAAISLEDLHSSSARLAWVLVLVDLAGVGLAAVVGRLLGRIALRPVRRLAGDVRYVARTQDLSRRVPALGPDELGSLGRSFNSMLDSLSEARRAQRQLVADASHELRTPLTTVRANVELLARDMDIPAGQRRQLRTDLLSELEELTDLVGDLVELARERVPEGDLEEVDFAGLVQETVDRARTRFPSLRFDVEATPACVRGDRARLRRAVGNLLDNAGKWSPPGGAVAVTLTGGELVVRDHGPGISDHDRARVFDRFYRAAEARGLPGSGLGLAIVRQVAEMHGGSAWVAPGGPSGAEVHLRLPGALPAASSPEPGQLTVVSNCHDP
jgi:two-component system sensor histidine kinase MprB